MMSRFTFRPARLKLEGLCRRHGVACGFTEKNCEALLAGEFACQAADSEEEEIIDEEPDLTADADLNVISKWREPHPTGPPAERRANGSGEKRNGGNGSNGRGRSNHRSRGKRRKNE